MTGYKITIEVVTDKSEKELEAEIMMSPFSGEIAGYQIQKV